MKTKETSVKQRLYNKKYNSYAEWNGSAWEDKSIAGAYFHSMEKANANGWFEETSTREQALAWWNNLKSDGLRAGYAEKNIQQGFRYKSLTGREIEEIYVKEHLYCVSSNSLVNGKPCEKWCGDINCLKLNKSIPTRQQALAWWSNLPFNSSNNVSKTSYCKKYYGNFTLARTYDTLTDREIEEIWRKETKEVRFIGGESLAISVGLKPNQKQSAANEIIDLVGEDNFKRIIKESDKRVNQKQYTQEEVDRLLDQQAARTAAQIIESNQKQFTPKFSTQEQKLELVKELFNKKQFKQFSPELFDSYCMKFSDKDRLQLAEIAISNCKISFDDSAKIIEIIRKYR
jgi:hypothetical protein